MGRAFVLQSKGPEVELRREHFNFFFALSYEARVRIQLKDGKFQWFSAVMGPTPKNFPQNLGLDRLAASGVSWSKIEQQLLLLSKKIEKVL